MVYLVRQGQDASASKASSKVVLPRSDDVDIGAYTTPSANAYRTKTATEPRTQHTPKRPDPNPVSPNDEEVFNISNNIYTYQDAPAVCKAFNATLATAKQVEQAFENGADWCNYGWTQGQLALYPTQQSTYNKLKNVKGHKNDCGRVGVNGGFFQNPNLEFGVNCYGKKPEPNVEEKALIGYFPDYISEKERRMQERVEEIKQNMSDIRVSPFNRNEWDEQRTVLERVEDWVEEV